MAIEFEKKRKELIQKAMKRADEKEGGNKKEEYIDENRKREGANVGAVFEEKKIRQASNMEKESSLQRENKALTVLLERRTLDAERAEYNCQEERRNHEQALKRLRDAKDAQSKLVKQKEDLQREIKHLRDRSEGLCSAAGRGNERNLEFSDKLRKEAKAMEQLQRELQEREQEVRSERENGRLLAKRIKLLIDKAGEDELFSEIEALGNLVEKTKEEGQALAVELKRKETEIEHERAKRKEKEEELHNALQVGKLLEEREGRICEKEKRLLERESIAEGRDAEWAMRKKKDKVFEEERMELQKALREASREREDLLSMLGREEEERAETENKLCELKKKNRRMEDQCFIMEAAMDQSGADRVKKQVELGWEIEMYKRIVRCTICEENNKDTVIVRCGHLFCLSCAEDRLKTRLRKCPTCGEAFGASDVRRVYL
eukprot:GHVN01033931.1.p3 GENE.GHVN01033931.1~~GHVN01033931.1.p3  ORF type:complete len:434 (+),score=87.78 GHVN01033931.1:1171-2472(+)